MEAEDSKVQSEETPKYVVCITTSAVVHIHRVRLEGIFQFSFPCLNVMCYCLLFNLCFTIYRVYNVAELIPWLESSFLDFFLHFWPFFWPGFSDSFYIFIYIICRRTKWLECMLECSSWDLQEVILWTAPPSPKLLLPTELAEWAFECIRFFCFLPHLLGGEGQLHFTHWKQVKRDGFVDSGSLSPEWMLMHISLKLIWCPPNGWWKVSCQLWWDLFKPFLWISLGAVRKMIRKISFGKGLPR